MSYCAWLEVLLTQKIDIEQFWEGNKGERKLSGNVGINQSRVYGSLSPTLTCYRQILGVNIYTTEEIIGRNVTKSTAPSRFFWVSPVHLVCRHNIGDHSFWPLCLVLMPRWAPGSLSVGRKLICSGPHPGPCIRFGLSSLWWDQLGSALNVFQGQTKLEPLSGSCVLKPPSLLLHLLP